ncbi:MAG: DUF1698 domain-containing protein [Chthoniobacterales bacterium]
MTRDEILAGLKILEPWFHRIDLGDGIFTKTESVMGEPVDHPRETWEVVQQCLPADLKGKSVLDVGCNSGFYCVEAKRRGAQRVLGVDGQRQHIRQALFVRKVLGLDLEFRRFSVYDLDPATVGVFDITLALGLVYHLKHLVLALERLYDVTRGSLVVETAIIPPKQTPPSFVQSLGEIRQTLHPLFYAENSPEAKEQVYNWFLPSPEALRALLINTGFAEVNVFNVTRDRAVLVCSKDSSAVSSTVHDFAATLSFVGTPPTVLQPNESVAFKLRATNSGHARWPAVGAPEAKGIVRLGAHLLRADEDEVNWDGGRAILPRDLSPRESAEIEFAFRAPQQTGDYIIEFDMVAEHVTWFEDFGAGVLRHRFSVA